MNYLLAFLIPGALSVIYAATWICETHVNVKILSSVFLLFGIIGIAIYVYFQTYASRVRVSFAWFFGLTGASLAAKVAFGLAINGYLNGDHKADLSKLGGWGQILIGNSEGVNYALIVLSALMLGFCFILALSVPLPSELQKGSDVVTATKQTNEWDRFTTERGYIEYLISCVEGDSVEETHAMQSLIRDFVINKNRNAADGHKLPKPRAIALLLKGIRLFRAAHSHFLDVHGKSVSCIQAVNEQMEGVDSWLALKSR